MNRVPLAVASLVLLFSGLNPTPAQTIDVATVRPHRDQLRYTITLNGALIPYRKATLRARASGYLSQVSCEEGDRVHKGDVVARIAAPELEARKLQAEAQVGVAKALVAEAESDVKVAETRLRLLEADKALLATDLTVAEGDRAIKAKLLARRRLLLPKRAATQEEVEEAEAEVMMADAVILQVQSKLKRLRAEVAAATARIAAAEARVQSAKSRVAAAEADLANAETMIRFTRVIAPFDGVVVMRRSDPGALVEAGETAILDLVDTRRVRLRCYLPEKFAAGVSVKSSVGVRFESLGLERITATVTRLAGTIDKGSHTRWAEVILENPDGAILPGGLAHVDVTLQGSDDALLLPLGVLVRRRGRAHVLVVEDGVVKKKTVRTGLDDGHQVEILDGLSLGDDVILRGQAGLQEGARVVARPVGAK
ncbi:MAG TPA: efflux RND transporter periplasmic adaptor subunit [Planctomycetes bacterium]|nr:efflux RND transporter periplasmic adaptor subunit [Planctomycetota bacterium]